MKYIIITFILFIVLSSCSSTEAEKPIELEKIPSHFSSMTIDDSTSFSFPKELLPVDNLKLSGDHQFSDLINVQYLVIQEDEKEKELKVFSSEKIEQLQRKMVGPTSKALTSFQLNQIYGFETYFETDVYGWPTKLAYWISIVELRNKFVTTITWTTTDRKEKFQKDAELIVKSFRDSTSSSTETD